MTTDSEPPADEIDVEDVPALVFDHNVIEHLGIKLYQNKPANVLAELVSNSWDADSANVWISIADATTLSPAAVAVADNGSGMTLADIKARYLVVGQPKRSSAKERSPKLDRKPMGRKGIGKLAPFGIATRVDVVSLKDGELNWFTLELAGLKKVAATKRYEPHFAILQGSIGDVDFDMSDPLARGAKWFLEQIRPAGQGTLVLMSGLTANQLPTREEILGKLAARFTVVLARDDFQVSIAGRRIERSEAIPEFDLRIPPDPTPYIVESLGDREISYWVGFFKSAEKTTDESGVGVYTHGKIAQDRPFYFYSTGKEVFQRYLYAVVVADWLDDLEDDLISTDRTSINWDHPEAQALAAWGKTKVGEWLTAYDRHRKARSQEETTAVGVRLRKARQILNFSKAENEAVDRLVADATGSLAKSQAEKAREDLLQAVTKAWANEPTRQLIKRVWDSFGKLGASPDLFEGFLRTLDDNSVPESMGLALTFAQRAYALTVLTKLVHGRSETNLQDLIEEFPWIIDPRSDVLTADQQLKTTINEIAGKLSAESRFDSVREIQSVSDASRADFVFLTDSAKRKIRIVELKAPASDELKRMHETQLVAYINYVENIYNSAVVDGVLIGNRGPGNRFEADNKKVTVKSWDDLLLECRSTYISMLAGMMHKIDIDDDDSRLALIEDFAGPEVWELLEKIAETDGHLKKVMSKLAHLVV